MTDRLTDEEIEEIRGRHSRSAKGLIFAGKEARKQPAFRLAHEDIPRLLDEVQ